MIYFPLEATSDAACYEAACESLMNGDALKVVGRNIHHLTFAHYPFSILSSHLPHRNDRCLAQRSFLPLAEAKNSSNHSFFEEPQEDDVLEQEADGPPVSLRQALVLGQGLTLMRAKPTVQLWLV